MPAVVEDKKIKKIKVTSGLKEVSGTDPVTLVTCSIEKRKYVLKKIYIYNPDTADHVVTIGSYDALGTSWDADKLPVPVAAGEKVILTEDEIPTDFVMTKDSSTALMAWAAKLEGAVTANNVQVKIETEVQ